ncbi:MAG: acyltransferase [Candidatus Azobacteroides sp.]|nr:acyltransferase [Candidatus Azobacteroides sp.]
MITSNIQLGIDVYIDPTTSINNVTIGNHVKIAKYCSIFGSTHHPLEIGDNSYIGMLSIINGYAAKVVVGKNVSIAQRVNIMADSGPNASPLMQQYYPILTGNIIIGDHSWIGANAIIMPGVELGEFCVVAANSFVNKSFPSYSVIGGNPAKLLKKLTL